MNRPLVWVAVSFVGGMFLASSNAAGLPVLSVVAGACGAFALVLAGSSERLVRVGCVLLFASGGALYWGARHQSVVGDALLAHSIERADTVLEVEGEVERPDIFLPELGYGQFTLRADRFRRAGTNEWSPVVAGVQVRWDEPSFALFAGDRVRVRGALEHALSTMNPGVSSYEDHLRRRDIHTAVRLWGGSNIERIAPGSSWSPLYWASRLRYEQAMRLVDAVPDEIVPFLLTVWLGERRLIDASTYRVYVESGTAHILAVSGVHTGIVYVSTEFLLLLFLRDYRYRRVRKALVLVAVLVFALVAGARISSLRASTMIALYVVAEFFDRDPDAPTALSLAAILFSSIDPDVLFDPGFILSFLAISSLLVFRAPIDELLTSWPRALREGMSTSLAVQVLPLPAAAAIFSVVPILGTIANLIVVPLLSVALWIALLTSMLSVVWMPGASIIGHALYPVVSAIEWIAVAVSNARGAYLDVSRPTLITVAVYVLTALGLYRVLRFDPGWKRWAVVSVAGAVVVATIWGLRPPVDEVVFLDVGQGDATIIRTNAGAVMVVDAGDRIGSVDYGERSVAAYLRSHGETRIHALVGTHGDKDHQGGMEYLIRNFTVDRVYLTYANTGDPIEETVARLCRERGIPVYRLAAGDSLPVEGAHVRVMHPPNYWTGSISDNERSVVLLAEIEERKFLLTGDIERGAESRLLGLDPAADVLKVPHHGSQTSSSMPFLEAVAAEYAIVSTGRQGRRRILSEAVLERYADFGATVFRTDYSGGIRFRYDGRWRVETARGHRGYPHPGGGTDRDAK